MAAGRMYPVELKERAVAMVREVQRSEGVGKGEVGRIAAQLGVHPESLRYWVRRDGQGRGVAGPVPVSVRDERVAALEKEVRELRRVNEILRLASAFFAREIDLRPPR